MTSERSQEGFDGGCGGGWCGAVASTEGAGLGTFWGLGGPRGSLCIPTPTPVRAMSQTYQNMCVGPNLIARTDLWLTERQVFSKRRTRNPVSFLRSNECDF